MAALRRQGPPVQLVVVDNASRPAERQRLEALEADVRVVWNARNVGYGAALNGALALADAPVIGFLNPDVAPFPEALARLLAALEADPAVGAVGPRMWWDEERRMLLPPVRLPTLSDLVLRALGRLVPAVGRRHSRRLARWVARVGLGPRPRALAMLSGGFLLTRRSVLERVGGFDPRFPLYFEDADWCRRVRRAGYRLLYVPAAEIAHYFDQSGRQDPGRTEAWRAASLRAYLDKYYGPLAPRLVAALHRLAARAERPPRRGLVDLGRGDAPPAIGLPPATGAVQVAQHWLFYDAAMAPASPGPWTLPRPIAERLRPGRYYLRALTAGAWRTAGTWTWEKPSGAPAATGRP